MTVQKDILDFKHFTAWVLTLNELDSSLWTKPIAKGKWSISEIIAHIMNWDRHIRSSIIPSVLSGNTITFPSINRYNQIASEYARSGITQSALIEEAVRTREALVAELLALPDELFHVHLDYDLAFLIHEFVVHDDEHKEQVVQFLKNPND
ncbi:DinB family protein [Paenibacillus sp. 2TAB23]|uniref:DinB family protein n=1 Tax=Paenibacillus sp. 2TAB23 TaxID=3233004 RepID=UPI003F9556BE